MFIVYLYKCINAYAYNNKYKFSHTCLYPITTILMHLIMHFCAYFILILVLFLYSVWYVALCCYIYKYINQCISTISSGLVILCIFYMLMLIYIVLVTPECIRQAIWIKSIGFYGYGYELTCHLLIIF